MEEFEKKQQKVIIIVCSVRTKNVFQANNVPHQVIMRWKQKKFSTFVSFSLMCRDCRGHIS
jgi:hypothetical protein